MLHLYNSTMICSPKLQLRKYQKDVVDAIGHENTIIKMPTGSGKTFVAAEFIRRNQGPKSTLFLVPACDLVTQQSQALKAWIGCDVAEYMGGLSCPVARFDVIVSTPQAFLVSKRIDFEAQSVEILDRIDTWILFLEVATD